MIKAGDTLPNIELRTLTPEGIRGVKTAELFANQRAVVFGVPGAFTPTCNDTHLPGFLQHNAAIRAKGVGLIACVAVNDAFVLNAWGKANQVGEQILMLSDGNGELARAMGLELDLTGIGLGVRNRRFATIIDHGKVTLLNVEPGREVGVSSAEAILAAL